MAINTQDTIEMNTRKITVLAFRFFGLMLAYVGGVTVGTEAGLPIHFALLLPFGLLLWIEMGRAHDRVAAREQDLRIQKLEEMNIEFRLIAMEMQNADA